jgi:uncharacterized protein YjiS (DUF1127 family)
MSTARLVDHELHRSPDIDNRFGQALTAVVAAFRGWREQRSAMRTLSNMSDAMLKDIGLTRGEISDLVANGRPDVVHRHHVR